MKSKHDMRCGARRSEVCDCRRGKERRIRRRAVGRIKRQRRAIVERTGLALEDTLVEMCNCGCGQSVAVVERNYRVLEDKLRRTPDKEKKPHHQGRGVGGNENG